MNDLTVRLNVRIVKLEAQRVASVYGFGTEPEMQAWHNLEAWAGPRGYLDDLDHHRIFGFNNPNPSPSSPNYGYELWITVEPEVEPQDNVRISELPDGLYAVARLVAPFKDPYQSIPEGWKRLVMWVEDSPYRMTTQQCLEEHLRLPETPAGEWSLDLYLPVTK